jgi:hypothetical protein
MKKLIIFILLILNNLAGFTQISATIDSLRQKGDTLWISNRKGSIAYMRTSGDSLYLSDVSGEIYLGLVNSDTANYSIKADSSIYSDTANYANKADSNAVTYTADTGLFNNMYNNRIKADNDSLNLDGLSILWDYSINNKDYKSGNNFDYLGLYDTYNILAYGNSSYRSQLSNFGNHLYLESRTLSDYFYKFDLFYNKLFLIYDTPSAAADTVYMFNPDSLLAPNINAKFNAVSSDTISLNDSSITNWHDIGWDKQPQWTPTTLSVLVSDPDSTYATWAPILINETSLDTVISFSSSNFLDGDSIMMLISPGVGKCYIIHNIVFYFEYGTATYSTPASPAFIYTYDDTGSPIYIYSLGNNGIIDASSDVVYFENYGGSNKINRLTSTPSTLPNNPYWIDWPSHTTGDGTGKLYINYSIINFN